MLFLWKIQHIEVLNFMCRRLTHMICLKFYYHKQLCNKNFSIWMLKISPQTSMILVLMITTLGLPSFGHQTSKLNYGSLARPSSDLEVVLASVRLESNSYSRLTLTQFGRKQGWLPSLPAEWLAFLDHSCLAGGTEKRLVCQLSCEQEKIWLMLLADIP